MLCRNFSSISVFKLQFSCSSVLCMCRRYIFQHQCSVCNMCRTSMHCVGTFRSVLYRKFSRIAVLYGQCRNFSSISFQEIFKVLCGQCRKFSSISALCVGNFSCIGVLYPYQCFFMHYVKFQASMFYLHCVGNFPALVFFMHYV